MEKTKTLNKITIDTSSDDSEDDLYTNFAARLRALKKRRILVEEVTAQKRFSPVIEQQINTNKRINSKEINDADINKLCNNNEIHNSIELPSSEDETVMHEYSIQTRSRSRMVRNRRDTSRNKNTNNATIRRIRGRHSSANDIQYNGMEIISIEDTPNKPISQSQKNIIELSDNDDNVDDGALSEDDNYEIYIKVLWRSNRLDRLKIHRHDSFQQIFSHYANKENVSENEILIMKGDKSINRTDTPASLKLTIVDILDGGIINPGINTLTEDKGTKDDNVCEIKVQTSNKKQSLTVSLRTDQRFKSLFTNCAEQLGIKEDTLKFYFDGEQINPNDTPESLDIEGEACIDLHIST